MTLSSLAGLLKTVGMATASPVPIRASGNLAVEWKRFKAQWNNYDIAAKLDREEKACQAAILLPCVGADAYEIYTTLEFSDEAHRADSPKLIDYFNHYLSLRHCDRDCRVWS